MREGHERFRQLPQPLFDQTCDGVDGVILQTNSLRTFTNTQSIHKQVSCIHAPIPAVFKKSGKSWIINISELSISSMSYLLLTADTAPSYDWLSRTSCIYPLCKGHSSPRVPALSLTRLEPESCHWPAGTPAHRNDAIQAHLHTIKTKIDYANEIKLVTWAKHLKMCEIIKINTTTFAPSWSRTQSSRWRFCRCISYGKPFCNLKEQGMDKPFFSYNKSNY